MDPTLGLLLALPPPRSLILMILHGRCRVPVADALIPLIQQLIIRHVIRRDVFLNLRKRPVCQRIDLDEARLVDLDDVQVAALATLAASAAREHGVDLQLAIGSSSRLDLGYPVVELVIGFPEPGAVFPREFLGGRDAVWLVDVDVCQGIVFADAVYKGQRLFEMVQCIQEDEIDHL